MPKPRPYRAQGQALRHARTADKHLTHREVAAAIGLNNLSAYQNWEAGFNRPDPSHWQRLDKCLGVNAAELYAGSDEPRGSDSMVKKRAIRPLLAEIRKNLQALELMVGPATTDKRLQANNIKAAPRSKEREKA